MQLTLGGGWGVMAEEAAIEHINVYSIWSILEKKYINFIEIIYI